MEKEAVYNKLNEIFEDVLALDENPKLTDSTSANDIDEWDSLSQVLLVNRIEKEFAIKFTSAEIISWQNVGGLVNSIIKKI